MFAEILQHFYLIGIYKNLINRTGKLENNETAHFVDLFYSDFFIFCLDSS
jgi:hypothetical protein